MKNWSHFSNYICVNDKIKVVWQITEKGMQISVMFWREWKLVVSDYISTLHLLGIDKDFCISHLKRFYIFSQHRCQSSFF